MGRPKGSKNKPKTVVRESVIKPKKIVSNSTKDRIQEIAKKEGNPPMPNYVLKLTDYLYITCDKYCWMVKEVVDKVNPATGEKYPDKPFLYAGRLCDILRVVADYMIRIPADVEMLSKKMDEIYSLIDTRVPAKSSPRALFKEIYQEAEAEVEDV